MKILGNKLLVSKVEEEVKEGFQAVEVMDSFIYKGKVEQVGSGAVQYTQSHLGGVNTISLFKVGDIILFTKHSPDTQEVVHEDKQMKIIRVEDVLAIYE